MRSLCKWFNRRAKQPAAENARPAETAEQAAFLTRLASMPAPVGAVLVVAGVVALPFPGPFGTPLIMAGGLILAPRVFGKIHGFLSRRFPRTTQHGMDVINRLMSDMERRYPSKK